MTTDRAVQTGVRHGIGLYVLTLTGDRICAMTRFDNSAPVVRATAIAPEPIAVMAGQEVVMPPALTHGRSRRPQLIAAPMCSKASPTSGSSSTSKTCLSVTGDAMVDQMGAYSLRSAEGSDAPQVADLVDAAYRHYVERIGMLPGPMTEDYARVIRDARVTVAERDGTIVGVIVLNVTDEGFVIENVAVAPSEQGTGLGRTLLELAEDEARHAGFTSLYLYTHEKMTENQALYSRIGYVEYDRRSQGDFSLVYMRKHLGSD